MTHNQKTAAPGLDALQCVIASLRDTAHFSDEEGELTNQLRELRDWAIASQGTGVPAPAVDALDAVRQALRDYHNDLDNRQHGGVAADKALNSIQKALGMIWVQGAEALTRAAAAIGKAMP